jgi:hypothetical protein
VKPPSPADDPINLEILKLLSVLESEVISAEDDLNAAVADSPIHGRLLALR